MSRCQTLAALLLAVLGAAGAAGATIDPARATAAAAAVAVPAEWRSFDLIVDLTDLPQAYSCDDLWYRFHDLLLAIGARPGAQILAYHCGRTRAESGRSPSVQLEFQLPQALPVAAAHYAEIAAVRTTIRLAPGELRSFTADDCELLRQASAALLAALPVRLVGTGLACAARGAPHHGYALEVQALVPHS
jgi:hypothetical protein